MKNTFILPLLFFWFTLVSAQSEESLITKAKEKEQSKDYSAAIDLYTKAIAKNPGNAQYYYFRGNVYVKLRKAKEAFLDYSKSLDYNSTNPDVYIARGDLYYKIQKPEESINDYTKSLKYITNDSVKIEALLGRSSSKGMKRDFQGAYDDCKLVLAIDSINIGALSNMGAALDELGRPEESTKCLQKVVEIDPTYFGGYINLGFRYVHNEDYNKAIEMFNKALELKPDEPYALNNRGYTRYKLNDLKGAIKDVNKSIEKFPGNSYAYKNRTLIYIAKNDIGGACEDINKALSLGFTEMYGPEVEELKAKYCGKK